MIQYDKSSYTIPYKRNEGLKFLYIKKPKLNEQLYKIHLDCTSTWHNNWQLIQSSIEKKTPKIELKR